MRKAKKDIFVVQPVLPKLDEFVELLEDIWKRKWLTNNGKYHEEFEKALAGYLDVPYISLFTNGTLALVSALQVLNITGEVITTPYSFVATTHALWWNNIKPVFVDIEPRYCNLDPDKIEAAITPQTTAIMPVHVYGNPCNLEKIQEIADRYGLKIIYDAAHAFGVKQNSKSVINAGDLSVLSFHATKVFNTIEGGAIVCHEEKTKKRIDSLKNFGIASETEVVAPGINAKMNEIQAAYGLLQLKTIEENIQERRLIADTYKENLENIRGISFLTKNKSIEYNYAYFPIFIDEEEFGVTRDEVYAELKEKGIHTRRYFYPLISQYHTYAGLDSAASGKLAIAEKVTKEVLCLPIYPGLDLEIVNEITKLLKELKANLNGNIVS